MCAWGVGGCHAQPFLRSLLQPGPQDPCTSLLPGLHWNIPKHPTGSPSKKGHNSTGCPCSGGSWKQNWADLCWVSTGGRVSSCKAWPGPAARALFGKSLRWPGHWDSRKPWTGPSATRQAATLTHPARDWHIQRWELQGQSGPSGLHPRPGQGFPGLCLYKAEERHRRQADPQSQRYCLKWVPGTGH